MKVSEFMTARLEFVDADNSVYDAVEKMVDRRIRSVVVRFPGDESNRGVITSRDVVFKVLAKGLNPKKIKASEIASTPIVCIDQTTEFEEAAGIMAKSNIARLFVCDEGRIIGIVSMQDVMAAELIMLARGNHDS